ncbi:hypothetical protein CKOHBEJN_00762 [Aeromonas hydrophila]
MVSPVTEQLMQASNVLLPPSLVTKAQERRDQYGQSGH